MRRLLAALALVFFVLAMPLAAAAEEFISAYHSVIGVAKDGTLTVTETITANVEGNQIRRGIYRDFPLTFVDERDRRSKVDFKLLSVERDGDDEDYRTESINGGIRIYTGNADVLLPHGEHTFQITYETSRQIRFFDDHDELYWNVTGTEWAFPIEEATATVTLPDGVKAKALDVFTGGYGATEKDARAVEEGDEIFFATTRRLRPQEGLTVAIKLPKGSIERPTPSQENIWWLRDHAALVIAGAGLLFVTLYYGRAWIRVGRDPTRGVMVPRWDPPEGVSPALVNYIDNKGFSGGGWTALSAAALNLAVRGHVVLEDLKNAIIITATGKTGEKLPTGEAALMRAVEAADGKLTIDRENGKRIQAAGSGFRSAMEREHRGKYYRANKSYVVVGIVLSAATLAALLIFGGLSEDSIPFVIVPVFLAVFIAAFAVSVGKSFRRSSSLRRRILSIVVLAFMGFVLFTEFSSILAALFSASDPADLPLFFAIGGIVLVNGLFYFLMGAPTPLGTRMMDGIDGLRQYLTLAEKDRLNMQSAPEMSPGHFETLLPYAVALGVEKPWSETFERWLLAASAGAAAAAYQPSWYHGDSFGPGSFTDTIGGLAGSMTDKITSSLPPPARSSSSGFSSGGGFSGGGGGGGGGGGW
ncbi:DUF2207 domain-containing protein [Sinorhizobium medicae]|uniref:DUF2207 domain-containing protein n=1 Tax=Sinorhizobium medicae TaxID=110321 RepID=UPI000C7A6BC5|nr:DUF2207 domain-containing protein [Sinorhizobium medicae]MBO1939381.1 DUF2207 domain-containing protein [Sinorhizobium medicae]MDX0483059.1 DUF2207 domain-containing protein [Sinorhizobium medicae]MDX0489247.1 DUF2207 domain-containing protein [Sinorhizobium medicae]MDX0496468.1 DUF2207 domain-containing protein [Sinorhizobium medicae]MDX0507176.1 DUF2207 domain-containing protein [Sinorhizobium medicae]